MSCMQARFAVLSAMDTYLHASPTVQRAAVRRWQPIAAIFALLWDETMRKVALSMVSMKARLLLWNAHAHGCVLNLHLHHEP